MFCYCKVENLVALYLLMFYCGYFNTFFSIVLTQFDRWKSTCSWVINLYLVKVKKKFEWQFRRTSCNAQVDHCSMYLTVCTRQRLKSTALFCFALNCRVLFWFCFFFFFPFFEHTSPSMLINQSKNQLC